MRHVLLFPVTLLASLIISIVIGAAADDQNNNEAATEAANFVLQSLGEINDSDIYAESLRLHSIHKAQVVDGLYYVNTLLTIEFSSDKFASGNETEVFEVIVMESKLEESDNDGDGGPSHRRRGYAIDRFPKMKDEEIESSLRRKVNRTVQENKKIRKQILASE